MTEEKPGRPALQVIRGDASPEEVAALLAVIAARGGAAQAGPASRRVGSWSDPAALTRRPPRPGPGAWQAATRPR